MKTLIERGAQTPVVVISLGLLALAMRSYAIGAQSIWFDEAISLVNARQSLPECRQNDAVSRPQLRPGDLTAQHL